MITLKRKLKHGIYWATGSTEYLTAPYKFHHDPITSTVGTEDQMFSKERAYKRKEIQDLLGGEIQTFLPQKNGRILAGCFNLALNPDCPNQIQAGKSSKVRAKAELLISQPENVFPVFVKDKKTSKAYSYIGNYRCIGGTCSPEGLNEAELRSGRIDKLSYLLNLSLES